MFFLLYIEPLDIEDERLLEEEVTAPKDSQRYD